MLFGHRELLLAAQQMLGPLPKSKFRMPAQGHLENRLSKNSSQARCVNSHTQADQNNTEVFSSNAISYR